MAKLYKAIPILIFLSLVFLSETLLTNVNLRIMNLDSEITMIIIFLIL